MGEADQWNANLYDTKHSFVSGYGGGLLEVLAPKQGERILDLGCGTGDLAKQLLQTGADVIGVDRSENMVQQAMQKYPGIPFIVRDATKLGFDQEFDAVFSNAVLHWIKEPKQALSSIYQSIKPGGRFVAEMGGKGNVQHITGELVHQLKEAGIDDKPEHFPWYYPSMGEYTSLMEEAGFRVVFAQHFDRPTPLEGEDGLKNWIRMFGSQLLEQAAEEQKEEILDRTEQRLRDRLYKEGQWVADYKRLRVIGLSE